jgi:hypothetical protein
MRSFDEDKVMFSLYDKAIKTFLKELKFDRIIESENTAPLHEVCTSHTARKTFHSYAINTLHLSATEVSKITGTSPETINKHYAGADIEEIAKKMRGLDRSRSAIDYYLNLMSISLRGYIELSASMSNGKPIKYYRVGNKYKIKIG